MRGTKGEGVDRGAATVTTTANNEIFHKLLVTPAVVVVNDVVKADSGKKGDSYVGSKLREDKKKRR